MGRYLRSKNTNLNNWNTVTKPKSVGDLEIKQHHKDFLAKKLRITSPFICSQQLIHDPTVMLNTSWIKKIHTLPKIKYFLWLAYHKKIPQTHMLFRRQIMSNPLSI